MPGDDRTLIERLKQGDREAGGVFFSKYIDVIYRTLKHELRGVQDQDLKELTGSVCYTIIEELGKYNPRFAVSTWVNNLILRHRVGFLREREKQQKDFLPLDAAMDPRDPEGRQLSETLAEDGPDALDVLEEKEEVVRANVLLQKFLESLDNDKDRDVFIDQHLFGLTYAAIAEKHGLTLDAVKSRLKRTRQKWAAFLKEHQGAD